MASWRGAGAMATAPCTPTRSVRTTDIFRYRIRFALSLLRRRQRRTASARAAGDDQHRRRAAAGPTTSCSLERSILNGVVDRFSIVQRVTTVTAPRACIAQCPSHGGNTPSSTRGLNRPVNRKDESDEDLCEPEQAGVGQSATPTASDVVTPGTMVAVDLNSKAIEVAAGHDFDGIRRATRASAMPWKARHGNDMMQGSHLADDMFGGWGNDTLYGKDGNDRLYGGEWQRYAGWRIRRRSARTAVPAMRHRQLPDVVAQRQRRLECRACGFLGDAEGDTYVGIENVTGSSGADRIIGNAGRQPPRRRRRQRPDRRRRRADCIIGGAGRGHADGRSGRYRRPPTSSSSRRGRYGHDHRLPVEESTSSMSAPSAMGWTFSASDGVLATGTFDSDGNLSGVRGLSEGDRFFYDTRTGILWECDTSSLPRWMERSGPPVRK